MDLPAWLTKHHERDDAMTAPKHSSSTSEAEEIQKLVASAQEQGLSDNYTGKRQWMRFTAGMRLEITTDPDDPSASVHVTMQNVSDGGFAFWSKREIRLYTPLFVREFSAEGDGEWVAAKVRHSTVGIRGYLVGGEFENSLLENQAEP